MYILCLALLACAVFADWKAIDTNLETFDTGVDFSSDLVGYTAGDDGSGPAVYKTVDGLFLDRRSLPLLAIAAAYVDDDAAVLAAVTGGRFSCDLVARYWRIIYSLVLTISFICGNHSRTL